MLSFIQNATLLITLIVIYTIIIQRATKDGIYYYLFSGILFGTIAVLGMMMPFQIYEGVFFDGRSVVISISGLFGGPITAITAAVIASLYRLSLGGPGRIVGVITIIQSGFIGVCFYYLNKYKKLKISVKNLLIFSLVVHIIMLLSFTLVPGLEFKTIINQLALPTLLIYPIATLIITVLIVDQEKKYSANLKIKENEENWRAIVEAANVGTWEWKVNSGERKYSEKWAEILGYSFEDVILNNESIYKELAHPKDFLRVEKVINKLLNKEIDYYDVDLRMKHKNGEWIWVNDRGKVISWSLRGKALNVKGTLIDITDKKNELDKLNLIFEKHSAIVLFIEAETGEILEANQAAVDFYEYSEEELLKMNIQDINMLSIEQIEESLQKIENKSQRYFTFPHLLKSGEIRMVDVYSSLVEYKKKKVLLSIFFDVTDKELALQQIKSLAYHDHLTGTYNRRYIEETFSQTNIKENQPIAFIIADINGLKLVNDSYGHAHGDELIKKTSQIIRSVISNKGVLARIGGDEFGVLLKNTTKEEVAKIAVELEENLELYITIGNNIRIYLSVAIGYAVQKDNDRSLDYLMKEAERHVYRGKYLSKRSMHSNMIQAMMSTLFMKSEREQLHSKRVGIYCEDIARALNWSTNRINLARVAGSLHDIGKIGVDESIMNKSGKLSKDEWKLMTQHPIKSAKILKEVKGYKELSDIVISHHERWDGKGYPDGLKGEEIPFIARVIAVADAYDAMIEERPYKEKVSIEEAIDELRKCSGTQFDPHIANVFIDKVLLKR